MLRVYKLAVILTKRYKVKITKYDIHVHAIENLSKQIIGKYFIVADDDERTIRHAIWHSDDETFKPYIWSALPPDTRCACIDNPKYLIHMVADQELCQCEIDTFNE
jgi:hypothetical protein